MENRRDKKAGEEERHISERQNLRRLLVLSHQILRYMRYKHYNLGFTVNWDYKRYP
jgi:hypothetical protein